MKKNAKIICISELVLFIYLIVHTLLINIISNDLKNILTISILFIMALILFTAFGFKKDNSYLKGSASRTVLSGLMTFMLIIYGLGIILGFNRGFLTADVYNFVKNVLFVLIVIILLEIVRFLIAKNCFQNVKLLIFFTILSSMLNIFLELNLGTLNSSEDIFIFLSTIIFPVLAAEALCSFMAYKIGLLPCLIYKIVMGLYIYLLPIVPDLGDYIYSVVNIIFPFTLYCILNKMIIRYEKEKTKLKKANRVIFIIPTLIAFIILVILVSGLFRYKMIAIASDSMRPEYARGDAIIYEKIEIQKLEVGDILAFQKDDRVVTHRIVKIWNQGGEYSFVTKGDNNNSIDTFVPKEANVLGKVRFKIKYIGYPTVKMNEFFGKE